MFIYEKGDFFSERDGNRQFEFHYFNPLALENSYQVSATDTFLVIVQDLFPVKISYIKDDESAIAFTDLFVSSPSATNLYSTTFTLQSLLLLPWMTSRVGLLTPYAYRDGQEGRRELRGPAFARVAAVKMANTVPAAGRSED